MKKEGRPSCCYYDNKEKDMILDWTMLLCHEGIELEMFLSDNSMENQLALYCFSIFIKALT